MEPMKLLQSLLLLLPVLVGRVRTGTDEDAWCPMNVTEPAPVGAHVVDGNLFTVERSYPPSQYRRRTTVVGAANDEYLLCTCAVTQCVRKCCPHDMVYDVENKGCSAPPEDAIGKFGKFTVSPIPTRRFLGPRGSYY